MVVRTQYGKNLVAFLVMVTVWVASVELSYAVGLRDIASYAAGALVCAIVCVFDRTGRVQFLRGMSVPSESVFIAILFLVASSTYSHESITTYLAILILIITTGFLLLKLSTNKAGQLQ